MLNRKGFTTGNSKEGVKQVTTMAQGTSAKARQLRIINRHIKITGVEAM